jgi:hypothetical protein
MAAGFFDTLLDNEQRQRSDINDLRDRESLISGNLQSHAMQLDTLRGQVHELSMIVGVMIKMLDEGGQLDAKILRYRIEAEVEALKEHRQAQVTVAEQGAPPVAEPPPTMPTTCSKCGTVVPANRTVITEQGTICDRCGVG